MRVHSGAEAQRKAAEQASEAGERTRREAGAGLDHPLLIMEYSDRQAVSQRVAPEPGKIRVAGGLGQRWAPYLEVRATPLYDGMGQLCTAIRRISEHNGDDQYGGGC